MKSRTAAIAVLSLLALGLWTGQATAQSQPDGQLTIAFDVSIALTFLDPAETPGIGVPFVFLYALHDALIKPLPGNDMAPCLAESWKESPDGLVYEFKLREGLKFHNGDPFTADDVKFSFLRYRGASAKLLHDRVKSVDILDPHRIRFVLHAPWPDFLVFYATPATGAAWIVPKKYIEKVGEADIAYVMIGLEAIAIKTDPKLRLAKVIPPATWWMEFPEQWNPKSPWSDRRVRLAANLALDKQALNEAERLGFSRLTGSIIPSNMESALRIEPYPFDPAQAKRLLAEAGYPNGFDAGDLTPLPPFTTMGEAIGNYLAAVGIRTRVRSMERATFMDAWRSKKLGGIIAAASTAPGSAAVRLESFVISSAPYASGGYPDIDDLFQQQAQERDRKKREALLHRIQRLMHERVMFGPIFEPAILHGIGPRVEEPAVGLTSQLYFPAPYEDMRLKKP